VLHNSNRPVKIYHHYELWEDYMNGMYEPVYGDKRNILINKIINLMSDADLFGDWMLKVVDEWDKSCEQNLTDIHMNQRAWIGQAACCMALKCPEDLTRLAWTCISEQQKENANEKADFAIEVWNERKNNSIHKQVGKAGLQKRNTRRSASEAGGNVQSSFLQDDLQSDIEK
jgi:hypothetical protein